MLADRFDRILLAGLVLAFGALVLLLASGQGEGREASSVSRALEAQIAYEAKVAFLRKIYSPAEALIAEGKDESALLKLEELSRAYPGEAYGYILKGGILGRLGALEESIGSYVEGVRLSGDYIDEASPLSRREAIALLVERGLEEVGARARANPDNPTLSAALKNVYYLQSRLAGGCE